MRHLANIAITWTLTSLVFLAAANGQARYSLEGPGLESPEPEQPQQVQHSEFPTEGEPAGTEPVQAVRNDAEIGQDARPLVLVYSDPERCAPCRAFERWLAENGESLPYRFERRATPAWVKSIPTFHWRDDRSTTGWAYHSGWNGPDALRAKLPPALETAAPRLIDAMDALRKFAGTSGRFEFTPERPVNAQVRDGLTIRYSRIVGKWDATGPRPVVTFDNPQPEGTATFWGVSVGYKVLSAVAEDDKTVAVRTNWKTVRISVEGEQ